MVTNIKEFSIKKSINYLALIFAFFLPLSRGAISIISITILLLFLFQREKINQIKNEKILIALGIFIIFNLLSLLWVESENLHRAFNFIISYWYLAIIFPLALNLEKPFINRIFIAFLLGISISEIISYGMFFHLWQIPHHNSQYPSPFMHKIDYSILLSFTSLFLLIEIFFTKNLKLKTLLTIFLSITLIDMLLVGGRTGQLSFFVTIFLLTIFSFKNRIKALLNTTIILIIFTTTAYYLIPNFKKKIDETTTNLNRVFEKEDYCTSLGMRIGSWIVAKDIIIKNPLFGVGEEDNMRALPKIIEEKYPKMECLKWFVRFHYHNQYIQILTAIGVVGLLIFLSIFLFLAKIAIEDRRVNSIKIALISMMLVAFLTEPVLNKQFTTALFALIVGIIVAQNRIEREK